MTAQPAQHIQPKPRVSNVRTAKQATQRRVLRKARARHASMRTFCACLCAVLALAMLYVMLTSKLTSLNYALAKAEREKASLESQASRLDDQLAALESDDRLASLAVRLHMGDPAQFALVSLPAPIRHEDHSHLAFLSGLAGLLRAK